MFNIGEQTRKLNFLPLTSVLWRQWLNHPSVLPHKKKKWLTWNVFRKQYKYKFSYVWSNFPAKLFQSWNSNSLLSWAVVSWRLLLSNWHFGVECTRKSKPGLLEPTHSCFGLGLYWFLGFVEYRYSWIRFMWTFKTLRINSLLFLGSCEIRKLVRSSWWELEKMLCGLKVGWTEVIRQTVSFLLVCVFA